MKKNKIPIIVIAGATASGKTDLAVNIAKKYDGEVVSADSMQIYKYMNIGTAKPDKQEQQGIPHHMMDFQDPREPFSAADYTKMAHSVISDIYERGKLPIIAGGTGLYIDSLINDVDFGEYEINYKLRNDLKEFVDTYGNNALHNKLREIDPVQAEAIHENNVKRVIRAIEFYYSTGKRISEHQAETKLKESRYNALKIMIDWNRDELYRRIDMRIDIMISHGLVKEVQKLMDMGLTKDTISMNGIGYKEVIDYLEGNISFDEMTEQIKQNTRRYAKRQLTWFRRDKYIHIIPAGDNMCEKAAVLIDEWIQGI